MPNMCIVPEIQEKGVKKYLNFNVLMYGNNQYFYVVDVKDLIPKNVLEIHW